MLKFKSLALSAFAIAFCFALSTQTVFAAAPKDALIKGSAPTIYWNARDGKRYVMPNIQTFLTWFKMEDLNKVSRITDAELVRIPVGGNVVYRPGYKMVKNLQSDNKVYYVSRFGIIHWIPTEAIAKTLYGSDWNKKVDDIPDAFFNDYAMGDDITSTAGYNPTADMNSVKTPSDNILGLEGNETGGNTAAATYPVFVGDSVKFAADFISKTPTKGTINIYDERTGKLLKTCTNASYCLLVDTVKKIGRTSNYRYYATASVPGQTIPKMFSPTFIINTKPSETPNGRKAINCHWISKTTGWNAVCEDADYDKLLNNSIDTSGNTNNPPSTNNDTGGTPVSDAGGFTNATKLKFASSGGFLTYDGQTVTFTSVVYTPNTDRRNVTIKVYDAATNQVINTCTGTLVCYTNITSMKRVSRSLYSTAVDHKGYLIKSETLSKTYGYE